MPQIQRAARGRYSCCPPPRLVRPVARLGGSLFSIPPAIGVGDQTRTTLPGMKTGRAGDRRREVQQAVDTLRGSHYSRRPSHHKYAERFDAHSFFLAGPGVCSRPRALSKPLRIGPAVFATWPRPGFPTRPPSPATVPSAPDQFRPNSARHSPRRQQPSCTRSAP